MAELLRARTGAQVIQAQQPVAAYPAVEPGAAARAILGQSRALRAAITDALAAPEARRQSARRAYESVRRDVVRARPRCDPARR